MTAPSAPMRSALPFVALLALSACSASASQGVTAPSPTDAMVDVDAGGAPSQGPASAKVVVIEFGDFECPYCGAEEPIIEQMLKDYAGRIRFVFEEFPLSSVHPYAELAAEAALAANAQGKFWPYHDKLYANQSALARSDLDTYASQLGLDLTRFDAALDQGTFKAAVAADVAEGTKAGVTGTPTFFINGTPVVGAVPYSTLQGVIDKDLAKAP
jgi:protein-disulfide isomerase